MRNMATILKKQVKDTLRNKAVLIQFVMFPVMALIMTKSIQIEGMPPHFFIMLFATMYVGMAPLVSVASIISEEKEKNTLRVLLMARVTPWQYLAGVGSYVFICCMLG
ncbi:MAG: ABC transporter permease, partial [Acetatifactor sp.]|nr:ABC transporter permease [Acetatifactor sp.]